MKIKPNREVYLFFSHFFSRNSFQDFENVLYKWVIYIYIKNHRIQISKTETELGFLCIPKKLKTENRKQRLKTKAEPNKLSILLYLLNEGQVVRLDFFHIHSDLALAIEIILAATNKIPKKYIT